MGERCHRVRSVIETLIFGASDGLVIKAEGVAYRKTSPTWAMPVDQPFEVETSEGVLTAAAGDFVAYDEKSGHVWPVAAGYVALNYEQIGMEEVSASKPTAHILYEALEALSAAARHLSATDVANAEVNLAEPRYRPLTQLCAEAAASLQEHLEETVGLATGENAGLVTPSARIRALRPGG